MSQKIREGLGKFMEEIICYTVYLPEGEEHFITFMELLLDDRWADGEIQCQEEVYANIGDINHKLTAKQNYEFLLRAVQKYQVKAVGTRKERDWPDTRCETWEEYRTDCYIIGKYQEQLLAVGQYSAVVKAMVAKAMELPDSGGAIAWLRKMVSHAPEYYAIDDDTCPILIYRDNDFCAQVPASFVNGLAQAFRSCRQQVIVWDLPGNGEALSQLVGRRFKAMIGIQTRVFLSTAQEGYFHDLVGGPKFNMILDHPIGLRNLFDKHPKDYYALVHDRNYQAFIRRYWPEVKDCFCFPPGGVRLSDISSDPKLAEGFSRWEEKKYDVVFVGNCPNYRDFIELMYSFQEPYRRLAARFLHVMRRNPDYPAEKALQEVLDYYGISASDIDFLNLLETFRYVIACISSYYREKAIRTLLDAGIEIHVYGDSWKRPFFAEHKYLVRHSGIKMEESLRIIQQAKISLNIMSWHKDGFTERVLNSMLAGAVVLSDKSTRLEEEFTDGEDIILFDLARINELPGRVKELLSDNGRMQRIAENGEKKVMERHLWIHRAKELLRIISDEGEDYERKT